MVLEHPRKNHGGHHTRCKFTPFQKLDFNEHDILSSLTENNMIGCGGSGKVYRFTNGRTGEVLAVKLIICNNKKLDHKFQKQFIAEVEIFRHHTP